MHSPAPGPRGRGYDTAVVSSALLIGYSLDMTGELGELEQASAVIPPGTRIHVGSGQRRCSGSTWTGCMPRA
jgi:hypothetical protein